MEIIAENFEITNLLKSIEFKGEKRHKIVKINTGSDLELEKSEDSRGYSLKDVF